MMQFSSRSEFQEVKLFQFIFGLVISEIQKVAKLQLQGNKDISSRKSACTQSIDSFGEGRLTTAAGTKTFTLSSVDARVSSFPFVRARELDINYDNFFLALVLGRAGFIDSISKTFFLRFPNQILKGQNRS